MDSLPLAEYSTETEGDTVTTWIASEVGKSFQVNWTDTVGRTATSGKVCVDGIVADCLVLRQASQKVTSCRGVRAKENELSRFMFSAVRTTDEVGSEHQIGNADLGQIKLEMRRINIKKTTSFAQFKDVPISPNVIHEKAKKQANHCVTFAPAEKCAPTTWLSIEFLDPSKPVCATFIFKYRDKELLKAHDIIPTSPKPDPEPMKTQDQAKNKSQDSSAPSRVIKRSHSASPGVIDISSDEDEKPARKAVKTESAKKEKGKETMVNRKSLGDDVIDLT